MELFREERATLDRLLRLDPLRARRLVPVRAKQYLYDMLLTHYRPPDDPRAEAVELDDFELHTDDLDESLDLFAFVREPRR